MEEAKVIKLMDVRDNIRNVSAIMSVIADGEFSCDMSIDFKIIAEMCCTFCDDALLAIKEIIK